MGTTTAKRRGKQTVPPKLQSFTDVARESLNEASGDVQRGTEIFVTKIMASDEFRRRFLDKMVRDACYNAISGLVRENRSEIWQGEQPDRKKLHREQVQALARGTLKTLYDFPLPGGQYLGDANRIQVGEAAGFFEEQAATPLREAKFLRAVQALLHDDTAHVRDAIKLNKLTKLRAEVDNGQ